MEMAGRRQRRWSASQAEPSLAARVAFALLYLALAASWLAGGVDAVAVVGTVLLASLAVRVLVPWGRTRAWSRRHPRLESLLAFPGAFVVLGVATPWSAGVCALLAIPGGLLLAGLSLAASRRANR